MSDLIRCVGGSHNGLEIPMSGSEVEISENGDLKSFLAVSNSNYVFNRVYVDVYDFYLNLYVWKNDHSILAEFIENYLKPKF